MRSLAVPVMIAAIGLSACSGDVREAKQLVKNGMRDPWSTKFRDVRVGQGAVCGEVNGKNGFGAYEGFRQFVVIGRKVWMKPDRAGIDRSSPQALEESALAVGKEADFGEAWNAHCLRFADS